MLHRSKGVFFIILFFALFIGGSLFANNHDAARRIIEKGDKQFTKSHLQKAQALYFQALALDSTDAYTNFQIGAIYYLSDSIKVKSLPYFLKTIKYAHKEEDDTIIDAYYYIGNCYALLKNYPAAITAFNKYLQHIDPKSRVDETVLQEVQHSIEICTDAPAIINRASDSSGYMLDNKPHPIYVKNAGGTINSPYPEYAQVLMNHDSTIIFTSRRPASQSGKKDFMTDEYYEDIFISHKDSGHWQTPTIFSNQLHFKGAKDNLASVTITSDGNTLFIYNKGRIWEIHPEKGAWSKPQKASKNLGISHYIPSVFMSFDGKKLFLVSDGAGGYGGKDIYESDKGSDGKWTDPVNLGPTINTSFDEDSPFMLPDNKTLFFASKGHVGLGGYDIFKSVYENGKWSTPVNLGAPINSTGDDIYFTYDTLLKEGFFSSSRINQGYGSMDIYSFSLSCDNIDNTTLKGEVVSNKQSIPNATITATDTKSNKTISTQSGADGKYSMLLKPERTYTIQVRIPDYLPYTTSITIPHQCDAYSLYQLINTSFVTDSSYVHTAQSLKVQNAFYRTNPSGNYKSAANDSALVALIRNNRDSATDIWEKDTVAAIVYTKAQRDSMNPRKVIATHIDTNHIITAAAIPNMPVVYFAFNKSTLDKAYYPKLDSLARFMKANKKYKMLIEGNTDTVGTAAYNQRLSIARATSVANYLVTKGVNRTKLHIEGKGKHHLAVVGDGSSALNRRDDLVIVKE